MEKVCVSLFLVENPPHVFCKGFSLTHGFWQKWHPPSRPSFLQTSSSDLVLIKTPPSFAAPAPPLPSKKKKGGERARLNLLFISILLAHRDNFLHREICTQWRGWLARRLLLAREITPRVRCIVCIRGCCAFFFPSFFFCFQFANSLGPDYRVRLFITADQFSWGISLLFMPLRPYGTSAGCLAFRKMYLRKLISYIIIMLNLGLKQLWKLLPAVWRLMMMRQLDTGTGSLCVSLSAQRVLTPLADPNPRPNSSNIKLPSHMSSDSASLPVARLVPPLPPASPPVLFTCVCVQIQRILDISTQPIKWPPVPPRQSNLASCTPLCYFRWRHVSSSSLPLSHTKCQAGLPETPSPITAM